jgi:death-on-curing protein
LPNDSEHYVITIDDVLAIHRSQVALTGGHSGVRELPLIEAAIGRPYIGYFPTIEEKGAALLESLACTQGFVDGNKRTAVVALNLLLTRSGYALRAGNMESLNVEVEQKVIDLIERRIKFEDVVAWLRTRIVPIEGAR